FASPGFQPGAIVPVGSPFRVVQSERQESNLLGRVPETRGQPMAHSLMSGRAPRRVAASSGGWARTSGPLRFGGVLYPAELHRNRSEPAVGLEPTRSALRGRCPAGRASLASVCPAGVEPAWPRVTAGGLHS